MSQEVDEPSEAKALQRLQTIFPVQCHKSYSDISDCSVLYAEVQQYLLNIANLKHLFPDDILQEIAESQEEASLYRILFYPQFASALILRKLQPYTKTTVSQIFLKEFGTFAANLGVLNYYADNPQSYGIFQLGQLSENLSIEDQMQNLQSLISNGLGINQSNLSKHRSSQFFKKIISNSLANQNQVDGKQKKKLEAVYIGQEGASDINFTNFPRINVLLVTFSLAYCLKDQDLAFSIMLSFKIYRFHDFIKGKFKSESQTKVYIDCLKDLISQYKILLNKHIPFEKKKAEQYFNEIKKSIEEEINLERQVIKTKVTKQELKESLLKQSEEREEENMNFLLNYSQFSISKLQNMNEIGWTPPWNVPLQTPFTYLENLYSIIEYEEVGKYSWILLVQKTIFSFAVQLQESSQRMRCLLLSQLKQNNFFGYSPLHSLLNRYEDIMININNSRLFGMRLKNQGYSHLYLLKYIASAITFQKMKIYKQQFNFQPYRIDLNVHKLYNNFVSVSYQARRALQHIVLYTQQNSTKNPIFSLKSSKQSYQQYILFIYEGNGTIQQLRTQKLEALQRSVQNLEKQLASFNRRRNEANKTIIDHRASSCPYSHNSLQKTAFRNTRYNNFGQVIQPSPSQIYCTTYQKLENQLKAIEQQTFNTIVSSLPFAEQEQKMFCVFQTYLQNDWGMIKLIYQSQIPLANRESFNKYNNASNTFSPLNPFSINYSSKRYKFIDNCNSSAIQFVQYLDNIELYYSNENKLSDINVNLVYTEEDPTLKDYQWMINRPSISNKTREHQIYANLDKKHKANIPQIKNMSLQQFINVASIRVGMYTQLPLLCQLICSRAISLNFMKNNHKLQSLIILNAIGQITSFKRLVASTHQNTTIERLVTQQDSIVGQSISQLCQNYLQNWKFQDLYSMHIVGVVFSLLSKLVPSEKQLLQIIKKAYSEFQKFRDENESETSNQNKLRLAFVLHAIMVLFNENICEQNAEASNLFAKIIVNYRLKKRIFTVGQNHKSEYTATVNSFKEYFQRAVFKNCLSACQCLRKNLQGLTQIVKQVDQSIDKKTVWSATQNNYIFEGICGEEKYIVNLYEGIILKNGSESSCLPLQIKKNKDYCEIFGKASDLQVFQMKKGSIRTRIDFSSYIQSEENAEIFFQFCFTNNQNTAESVAIRKIIKYSYGEQSYLLIPKAVIQKLNIYIPQIYTEQYLCWLDQSNYSLIFRQKSLKKMKKIGLVLLGRLKSTQDIDGDGNLKLKSSLIVYEGRIITKQFQNQPLAYLTDPNQSSFFDKLFLISKMQRNNKAIEILELIQLKNYIIQLVSSDNDERFIFWLHRSNARFIFDEGRGLVSQNYNGYAIAEQYGHHQLLPWRQKDKIKCLVLVKEENNFRNIQMHQFMLITLNRNIEQQGDMKVPVGELQENELMSFQIHDTFKDIRSSKRQNQLHMACLICATSLSLVIPSLKITSQQYCIDIVRSCYSNIPLQSIELAKWLNLFNLSFTKNMNILSLICAAFFKLTSKLANLLPFKKQNTIFDKIQTVFKSQRQQLQICKFIYRQRYQQDRISIHEKLTSLQMNLLEIDPYAVDGILKKKKKTCWYRQESMVFQIQEKNIKSIKNIGTSVLKIQKDMEHLQTVIFQFFEREEQSKEDPKQYSFLELQSSGQMEKEMQEDLLNSYESFIRYNQKYEKLELTKEENIGHILSYYKIPKTKCQKLKVDLMKQFNKINDKLSYHIDIIHGSCSLLSSKHFTLLLSEDNRINQFFPKVSKQNADILKDMIRDWISLTLEIESFERIMLILKERPIDKVALFRQLESPRKEINKKNHWLCFQAQMKLRIWLSQYDTYKYLIDSKSGSVAQLNMGEGKTQVIIPMIVLDNLYDQKLGYPLSRINILTSLFQQAQNNYFKFFSVTSFRIPCFSLYFNRDVIIKQTQVNILKTMIYLLKKKVLILMDRQSCLSMILKIRQMHLSQEIDSLGYKRDDWLFEEYNLFDIFDEVDALMTAKKSFVYSIGCSQPLSQERIRYQVGKVLLQIVCHQMLQWLFENKMLILQQTLEQAIKTVKKGSYPKGMRLLSGLQKKDTFKFKEKIVLIFLENRNYRLNQFSFYEQLDQNFKKILIEYLTDSEMDFIDVQTIMQDKLPQNINQILALRGYIAMDILEHSLRLRNGVVFGAPGKQHPKRIGVPYEAADVPSTRSQYSQPDVAILLSYISYFNKGLSYDDFQAALFDLFGKVESLQNRYFTQWLETIEIIQDRPSGIINIKQINIDSIQQLKMLHQKFQYCRSVIIYWLQFCVFPNDLKQYKQSITASSWDIAYVERSIGFSGTKDTRWLFPNYLTWEPSVNDAINGTDGKMIFLMLDHTLDILTVKQGQLYLWQRFCEHVLSIQDENIGCIIDAGAILAGKSLSKDIVPWIAKHKLFDKKKFRGITYCNEKGEWKVYDSVSLSHTSRGTSIPEHQTFVIFDEARTRGADIKMKSNVRAVLSLSSNMTKDKLMQAVGRLRKFGRNQQLYIMGTSDILKKINGLNAQDKHMRIKNLIEWTCKNSINDNLLYFYPNYKLAMIHYQTVINESQKIKDFDSSLSALYSLAITESTAASLFCEIISNQEPNIQQSDEIKKMEEKIKIYESEFKITSSSFEDVCEREVETEVQVSKQTQKQHNQLIPLAEGDELIKYKQMISTIDFKFDGPLIFSTNFINCVQIQSLFGNRNKLGNELCKITFAFVGTNSMQIITQREVNLLINRGIKTMGPYSLKDNQEAKGFIVRFEDLLINLPLIQQRKLDRSLVHAKFFNGESVFCQEERDILFELIRDKYKLAYPSIMSIKKPLVPIILGQKQIESLEEIASHFLSRRRTENFKLSGSALQNIITQVKNISKANLFS